MYEWVERFRNRLKNVSDEHRSGRPVSVASETVKQQVEQRIRDYRWVTVDEIAAAFNMSHGSAYNIVHNHLGYRKVCSRWVPKSCPMITSVHGRRFVRNIWTVMFVKVMLFSIELWQETSPGCTIMNQRVRDNRCSGSTRRLRPKKKIQDTGFRWESHADHLLGCQWPYIGAFSGKGSNCD